MLVTYLQAYYCGISGTPSIINGNLLEAELTASGMVRPFVGPGENGAAALGVPYNITPDVVCDNISELGRMAVAALICLYIYLNFRQRPEGIPPDEALLVFSTVAIHSTADVSNAANIDKEIKSLIGQETTFGCAQVGACC